MEAEVDILCSLHNQNKDNNQFKTKNQNCHKIQLCGNPTTKELKKHSPRLVGVAEMGSHAERACNKAAAGRLRYPTFVCGYAGRNSWGARQTVKPRVPAWETKGSKSLALKACGDCGSRRNSQCHRRVHSRGPQESRTYTSPPTCKSAPERVRSACGKWGKWRKVGREPSKQASGIVTSLTPPPNTAPKHNDVDSPFLGNT